jgi:hypothetical protein
VLRELDRDPISDAILDGEAVDLDDQARSISDPCDAAERRASPPSTSCGSTATSTRGPVWRRARAPSLIDGLHRSLG